MIKIHSLPVKSLFLLIGLIILLTGCSEDAINPFHSKDSEFVTESVGLFETMKLWYLWNDYLPATLPERYYSSVEAALEYLRYTPIDRWSFVIPLETAIEYFEEGIYYGFGIGLAWDSNNNLWISLVYKDSDAYLINMTRGCQIVMINDTPVTALLTILSDYLDTYTSIDLTYIDLDGDTLTGTISKKQINIDYILHQSVLTVNSRRIGYLVYNSFNINSITDLDQVFSSFQDNNIDDLILDMRYNPGGRTDVSVHLASLISNKGPEDVFFRTVHNDNMEFLNDNEYFTTIPYSLGLDRLFVITTSSTASASELVINGLEPYMDVLLIGERTHGKPVGMYSFYFGDYAFFPVSVEAVNAEGAGGFYNGIEVDKQVADDLTRDFGDSSEACLAEVLYYIENGSFSPKITAQIKKQRIFFKGFRAEISAF
jgi:carboxyl-terminal processing protease